METSYKYNKIIDNIKNSFVNDYNFWQNILKSTNEAVTMYNESNNTNVPEYSYDDFCITFIEHIKKLDDESIFSEKIIQSILLKMIHID